MTENHAWRGSGQIGSLRNSPIISPEISSMPVAGKMKIRKVELTRIILSKKTATPSRITSQMREVFREKKTKSFWT